MILHRITTMVCSPIFSGAEREKQRIEARLSENWVPSTGAARHNGRRKPLPAAIDIFGRDQSAVTPLHDMDAVRAFQRASTAENTRRGNETDWRAFTEWCAGRHLQALPAEPEVVAEYLATSANLLDDNGDYFYAPGTLRRWLGSINKAHRLAGFPTPGSHPEVSLTIAGIARERARPLDRKAPLLLDGVKRTISEMDFHAWPHGIISQRDASMIVFGFAGAFRRSEIAELDIRDVAAHEEDGLHVRVRRSKTDQESLGSTKGLPFGANTLTCPPCAFVRWVRVLAASQRGRPDMMRLLAAVDLSRHVCRSPLPELAELDGRLPLFRPVMKNGAVKDRSISGNVVNDVVKRRVTAAGMNGAAFGAHSLRAGFVTQALRNGASHHEIMRQTDHKTADTVEIYSRETDPLRHNAVTRLGL
jgi:integrase